MKRLALDEKPKAARPLSTLGNSIKDFTCRFHQILEPDTLEDLLVRMYCDDCSASLNELIPEGQALEVCAEEHYSDPSTGERFLVAVTLCPSCHRERHLNASMEFDPCSFAAGRSWETF